MTAEIVIFAKAPVSGMVKTRLAATIGPDLAAACHQAFISDTVATVVESGLPGLIAYAGDVSHRGFDCARQAGFEFQEQPSGDLGHRMFSLLDSRLNSTERVVFVGTDSPTMPAEFMTHAVQMLDEADVVIGPSFDGGYYLIALKAAHHAPFEGIAWSTGAVFLQTVERCAEAGLTYAVLPFWYDVDHVEDLRFLIRHLRHLGRIRPDAHRHSKALIDALDIHALLEIG
jgi:rSAM/selenodomain-associated transferase 1